MSWTICTSGSAIYKAGKNANATLISYAGAAKTYLDQISDEAENIVCSIVKQDAITSFSSLNTYGKQVLAQFCSAHIAKGIINYDPNAYTGSEIFNLLNLLESQIVEAQRILEDDAKRRFIGLT